MTREELESAIETKKEEIDCFEIDQDDYEDSYRECLNEQGEITIGYIKFDPAHVLEQLDPTAYRCGLNDYVDGIDKTDDPKYKALEEELEELESELEDMDEKE
jgi:hypothetical protein